MASTRVQVILDEQERALLRREAAAAGTSLSAWIRQAALEKLWARRQERSLGNVEQLRAFFAACVEREQGREPEWQEHLHVVRASQARGGSGT